MEARVGPEPTGARRPKAKVQFARIEALTIAWADFGEALRGALRPGIAVSRYGRDWRMGQYREDNGYIYGRIGFQEPGTTEIWNDKKRDFEERELPGGTTSPFAIRTRDGEVAFQRRPGLIEPKSFTGALQGLLNEASEFRRWRVTRETREVKWEQWVRSVDRVVELRFRLKRPNPDYEGRGRVEEIIEGTNARLAELVLKAGREDDVEALDVDDETVRQAVDHAAKYGSYRAVGERAGEPRSAWRSDEEEVTERTIEADPQTRDAQPERLRDQLEEQPP